MLFIKEGWIKIRPLFRFIGQWPEALFIVGWTFENNLYLGKFQFRLWIRTEALLLFTLFPYRSFNQIELFLLTSGELSLSERYNSCFILVNSIAQTIIWISFCICWNNIRRYFALHNLEPVTQLHLHWFVVSGTFGVSRFLRFFRIAPVIIWLRALIWIRFTSSFASNCFHYFHISEVLERTIRQFQCIFYHLIFSLLPLIIPCYNIQYLSFLDQQ